MACARQRLCLVLMASVVATAPAAAVTLGQLDDFQDGTTQDWGSGFQNTNPPVNAPDVGPEELGDDSLMITSTGGVGPGSKFVAFNEAQWKGDYLAAGVSMIVLDVKNIGSTTLQMRVALTDRIPLGGGGGVGVVTTLAVPVSPGSGWQTIELSIEPGDLTPVQGADVNTTLASVVQFRILSAVNPVFEGDSIPLQGLVDNIMAVPEPSALLLLAASLISVGLLHIAKRSR